MKLIKPSAILMAMTNNPARLVELAGRTCYKSENNATPESAAAFVRALIKRGHEAVVEHASATVRVVCDRGVSHELVRHRLASYCQESTRYCNYGNGPMQFVIPPWVTCEPGECYMKDVALGRPSFDKSLAAITWAESLLQAEARYNCLLEEGWTPQQARSILPNSLKTEVVMTANFREWRAVFKLRLAGSAHPQMRELMALVFDVVNTPESAVFFEDLLSLRNEVGQ